MCYRSVYFHVGLSNCVNYLKIVYVLYAVSETLFTHMEYDFILPVGIWLSSELCLFSWSFRLWITTIPYKRLGGSHVTRWSY